MGGFKWNSRQYLCYLTLLRPPSAEAKSASTDTKSWAMGSVLLEVSEKSVTPLHPASYVATKLRVTYLSDLQVSDLGPETTYATFETKRWFMDLSKDPTLSQFPAPSVDPIAPVSPPDKEVAEKLFVGRIPADQSELKTVAGVAGTVGSPPSPHIPFKGSKLEPERRELCRSVPGIKMLGAGASSGSKLVANEDLAKRGYDSEWVVQRTGIKSRFHVEDGESCSDMAIRAAEACLKNTGIDAADIDLIIVATVSPDHKTPSTACLVQAQLGSQAAAMDLNAACSGFIYALVTASQFVRSGCSRNALVIGVEAPTTFVNPEDRKTFPLFGDGAGAVIITADLEPDDSKSSGILSYQLGSDGSLGDALVVPAGGSRKQFSQEVLDQGEHLLSMDGRTVFKWAVRLIPVVVGQLLEDTGMSIDEIDLFIPHQANIRIIDAAVETLGIDREKVFVNLDRYGNTSSASIPISIAEALEQGRIKPGSNVMMVGFGAGLTWGASLFRW